MCLSPFYDGGGTHWRYYHRKFASCIEVKLQIRSNFNIMLLQPGKLHLLLTVIFVFFPCYAFVP